MKITIESTTKLVELRTPQGVVPARIWEGATASGIPVHCYITRVAELLRTMKGRAIVSVNDIPAMREAFDGLPMHRVGIRYTVGTPKTRQAESGELLITNFEAP